MSMSDKMETMEYRYLGNSGIKVSNLCLGTMTFGMIRPKPANNCDEDLSHKIMDRYAAMGGNFLDTADIYSHGESESIVGRWLEKQTTRSREDFVVATKVRANMGVEKNVNNVGLSRRHITASIDKSLKRLHTDYVDLYQIHCWDEAVRCEETLRTLDDLVRCGKVRYVGGSNLTGWQLQKIMDTSKSMGLDPFVSLQQQYNLLSRWSELESFQVSKVEGLGVLPWSPLKGGVLSGKFKRNVAPSEGRIAWVAENEKDRKSQASPAWSTLDDKTFDIIECAERIGKAKGKSVAQVAVRWLLQKDVVSSVIIGVTNMQQLEDNMGAATGWTLSPDEMQELDDISKIDLPYPYEMIFRLNGQRKNPYSILQHVENTQ